MNIFAFIIELIIFTLVACVLVFLLDIRRYNSFISRSHNILEKTNLKTILYFYFIQEFSSIDFKDSTHGKIAESFALFCDIDIKDIVNKKFDKSSPHFLNNCYDYFYEEYKNILLNAFQENQIDTKHFNNNSKALLTNIALLYILTENYYPYFKNFKWPLSLLTNVDNALYIPSILESVNYDSNLANTQEIMLLDYKSHLQIDKFGLIELIFLVFTKYKILFNENYQKMLEFSLSFLDTTLYTNLKNNFLENKNKLKEFINSKVNELLNNNSTFLINNKENIIQNKSELIKNLNDSLFKMYEFYFNKENFKINNSKTTKENINENNITLEYLPKEYYDTYENLNTLLTNLNKDYMINPEKYIIKKQD